MKLCRHRHNLRKHTGAVIFVTGSNTAFLLTIGGMFNVKILELRRFLLLTEHAGAADDLLS